MFVSESELCYVHLCCSSSSATAIRFVLIADLQYAMFPFCVAMCLWKSELLLVLSKSYMVMVPTLPIFAKSGVSLFYFHFKSSQNSQNQKIFCSTHPRLLYAAYLFFIMTLMAFLNDPMFNLRIPILRKPSKNIWLIVNFSTRPFQRLFW